MQKCPNCGYVDRPVLNLPSNVMNEYVQKDNPSNSIIVNATSKELTIGKQIFVRRDLFNNTPASTSKNIVTEPAKSANPITPTSKNNPSTSK